MLFLGRQVEYKGLATTLEASVALQERYPHLVFLVVGPETEYSRQLFASYQGHPGILNLGAVSDAERLAALNACDCLSLPSTGEAFGIVFLEAWIAGKPVIGPRAPAVSAVVKDGQDGWLVPPGDSLAIAEAVGRWIDAPHLALEMGERGRQKVLNQYTCTRIADVIENAYVQTLRAHALQR
jgi:glycosyltransferase involved in cell wall biosynthesis